MDANTLQAVVYICLTVAGLGGLGLIAFAIKMAIQYDPGSSTDPYGRKK